MRTFNMLVSHIAAVTGLLLMSTVATHAAASSSTATAPASAVIISGLNIVNLNASGLRFGNIIPTNDGTVTVSPTSVRTWAGVDVQTSSDFSAAHFKVTGSANNTYTIALPTSIIIANSHEETMLVDNFTSDPDGVGTLDINGEADLNVGGTLHVRAGQPNGRYDGTFTVTVAYN